MKKSFLTILGACALLIGCQDAYEIDQPGLITEESQVFKDASTVNRGVLAIYKRLVPENDVKFQTVFTDEVGLGHQNGGAGINDGSYNFVLDSGNGYAQSFWYGGYGTIFQINRILKVVDGLINSETNVANLNSLKKSKAELLGLRAYCNLNMFAYFTPDYTNPSGLSIMKLDFIPSDDFKTSVPRSSVSEIEAFIVDDIEKAMESYFGDQTYSVLGNEYITKGALDAMLVKLFSMTGKYDKVIEIGSQFIGSVHGFDSPASYKNMYLMNDTSLKNEVIFRLVRDESESFTVADIWYTNRIGRAGNVQFDIGRSLYNELDRLDPTKTNEPVYERITNEFGAQEEVRVERADLRFTVNVHKESEPKANYSSLSNDVYINTDKLFVGKYMERERQRMQNDMIVLRYSDIILCIAEARASQNQIVGSNIVGDYSTVQSIIYNLRKARINPEVAITEPASMPVLTDASSAWKAILNERRVEFAFEGYRYFDVKRIGTKAGLGFERDPQDCARNQACSLSSSDFKLTLPIPRVEMNSNPALAGQQNPGY